MFRISDLLWLLTVEGILGIVSVQYTREGSEKASFAGTLLLRYRALAAGVASPAPASCGAQGPRKETEIVADTSMFLQP